MTARDKADPEGAAGLEAQLRITNPTGLHARPAVKLAQLAARFQADVWLRVGEQDTWVRAKSTAKVMKLKARKNSLLYIRAEGEQAESALAALSAFVKRDFDEQPVTAQTKPSTPPIVAQCGQIMSAQIAAPGVAIGPLFIVSEASPNALPHDTIQQDPKQQRQNLSQALNQAEQQLIQLVSGSASQMGAEVIAFQRGLIADEEFLAPVWQALDKGQQVQQAWSAHLAQEIETYQKDGDEVLRARVVDLSDLRDRVLRLLDNSATGTAAGLSIPDEAIVLCKELTPSRFLELDWSRLGGLVLQEGSYNSHVAMLARAHSVPMLIQLQSDAAQLSTGTVAIVDANQGRLLLTPEQTLSDDYRQRIAEQQKRYEQAQQHVNQAALSSDGIAIKVMLNVDDPALLETVDSAHCDGIGLTRTEFLFQAGLPDEESQYRVYRRIVEWAAGKQVTIRTLDAGGDKPVPGLTLAGERNPFLGVRGLRLMLARPDVFRVQLRALARAAAHSESFARLQVMLPMVTVPTELDRARVLLQAEFEALRAAGIEAAMPALGIMVEVPAAALTITDFDADFYSIGSNDLLQYLLAAARDSQALGNLHNPIHPALLELIQRVVAHGTRTSKAVSLCGELAAQTEYLDTVLRTGLRSLSVPAATLGRVKAALTTIQVAD